MYRSVARAIACYEREMSQRSGIKVNDSYLAARKLHYPEIQSEQCKHTIHSPTEKQLKRHIAGVPTNLLPKVFLSLHSQNITADLAERLDEAVLAVIQAEKTKVNK